MNEYIVSGKTGFLCNYRNPKPIDIKNIEEIQISTYEYIKQGYEKWCNSRSKIIDIIEGKEVIKLHLTRYYRAISLFNGIRHLLFETAPRKTNKLLINIRCWFVLDKEKKDKIRGKIPTKCNSLR